jgi:hypothetical protein
METTEQNLLSDKLDLATEQDKLSIEIKDMLASNKAFRTTLAQSVVQDITEGNLDATQALIYACKAEEFFKSVIDNVRPIVASKQIQKGGLKLYDTEIVEKKNPDKYDFTVCEDAQWNEFNALLNDVKAKMKARETFLKTLTEPMATMDGEIINPPAITYGAMNIAVTLK